MRVQGSALRGVSLIVTWQGGAAARSPKVAIEANSKF